jgi:hypothetical protein
MYIPVTTIVQYVYLPFTTCSSQAHHIMCSLKIDEALHFRSEKLLHGHVTKPAFRKEELP